MSLSGINSNPLLASLGTQLRPAPNPAATPGSTAGSTGGSTAGSTPAATPGLARQPAEAPVAGRDSRATAARPSIASVPTSVPAEAPPGTDPALWSVLTGEERTFFSKTAALGPLTYGKIKNATLPAPPAVRGGRLDVRA